jgi:hypothetical protein
MTARVETIYENEAKTIRFVLTTCKGAMAPGLTSTLVEWHAEEGSPTMVTTLSKIKVLATQRGVKCSQANIDLLHRTSREAAEKHVGMRLAALAAQTNKED